MCKAETPTPPKPSITPGATQPAKSAKKDCEKPKCKISSQTVATSPADRARTKIGIGEEVTVTYTPGSATWSLSGGGKLSTTKGSSVKFTAGDKAESVTIEGSGSGGTCSISFNVVKPSDMSMKRRPGTNLQHNNGRPDCGWQGTICVHPNDVNFYRVEIREKDSKAQTTGSYNVFKGVWHGNYAAPARVSVWVPLTRHTETDGSQVGSSVRDNIYSGDPGEGNTGKKPPFKVGTMFFAMTWQFRVVAGANVEDFPNFRQEHEITSPGSCESAKAGHSESCMYNDPTSTP